MFIVWKAKRHNQCEELLTGCEVFGCVSSGRSLVAVSNPPMVDEIVYSSQTRAILKILDLLALILVVGS